MRGIVRRSGLKLFFRLRLRVYDILTTQMAVSIFLSRADALERMVLGGVFSRTCEMLLLFLSRDARFDLSVTRKCFGEYGVPL